MQLVCRLEDLMWENRIKSINQLAEDIEISRTTLTRLKKNQCEGIRTETLTRICDFFECDISELLVFVSDEEYEKITEYWANDKQKEVR